MTSHMPTIRPRPYIEGWGWERSAKGERRIALGSLLGVHRMSGASRCPAVRLCYIGEQLSESVAQPG